MFSDTQQVSALTQLHTADTLPWEAPDLDQLVSSCCHLKRLSLRCSPGLQLTALMQLTALTWLRLTGVTEHNTVASLVQLSVLQGLQELLVMDPCCFTDDDAVWSLTALTQLTRLALSDSDGVYSTTMRQQLLQHGQPKLVGRYDTCHIIKNTVGTLHFGRAV